jgi:type IV pilus assembly protein PilB
VRLLSFERQKYTLGYLLVKAGVITPEQLDDALRQQNLSKVSKNMLGRTLVELQYCSEYDIARVVAEQAGVPFVSLDETPVDDIAASLVLPETARRYNALPIGFDKGSLLVAMINPLDIIAIDDLRILTGYDIQPVVCADGDLHAAIEKFGSDIAEIDQTVEEDSIGIAEELLAEQVDETVEKPAVQLANTIFNLAVRAGTSDVHIEPLEKAMRVRFRIDGVLHEVMRPPRKMHPSLVSRIKVMANMDIAERRVPQDGRITMKIEDKTIDFRVASLPTAYGEKLTLRLLDRSGKLITLEQLGFPPAQLKKYQQVMHLPYGFILVTGPTGSGKSTTLYATLSVLNSVEKHIVTVEDPIEYRLDGMNQMQVNLRAGFTFANGLRAILRNDPDIIMIGEIRDKETASIAVESALTGHLVLSTLHTNDASGAISRLGDMGVEPFLTASSLVGVVAQRLARVLCQHCKKEYVMTREELLELVPDFPIEEQEKEINLYRAGGCMRCNGTGYRGRVGIYELLLVNEAIRRLAMHQAPAIEIKQAAIDNGMVTLREDGLMKVKQGLTSLEEVMRVIV